MKVLVCGSRTLGNLPMKNGVADRNHPDWEGKEKEYYDIMNTLDRLSEGWPRHHADKYGNWLPNVTIITGGAKGVDSVAIDWAVVNWTEFKEYNANWKKHGKAAGPIRNQQMLDEGKPDLVVAFPGGRGTADMVKRAEKAGVEVVRVSR